MTITTVFRNGDNVLTELVFSNCTNYTNRLGNSYVSFEYSSIINEESEEDNPISVVYNYNTAGSLLEEPKTVETLNITSEAAYNNYLVYMGKYVSIDILEDDIYKITINKSYLLSITIEND